MTEFNEYVTPRLEVHDSDIESEFKQNHIVFMVTLKLDTLSKIVYFLYIF